MKNLKLKEEPTERQNNKKLISFKHFDLINRMIHDQAIFFKKSESAVIEQILLDKLLPEEEIPKYYVKSIYENDLKTTYERLMQNLAAGINFQAAEENSFPLIKFGMNVVNRYNGCRDEQALEALAEHFKKNKRILAEKLQFEYQDKEKEMAFDTQIRLKDDLLYLSADYDTDFIPYNYFEMILHHWQVLGTFTYTFRLLYDVVAITTTSLWDTPENKIKAAEVITEVTREWKSL